MYENIITYLNQWNVTKNERQKLQHVYIVAAIVIVLVAGIISLFDPYLGHDVVTVALYAVIAFLANAVIWNLLQSSLISKLSTRPKRK